MSITSTTTTYYTHLHKPIHIQKATRFTRTNKELHIFNMFIQELQIFIDVLPTDIHIYIYVYIYQYKVYSEIEIFALCTCNLYLG